MDSQTKFLEGVGGGPDRRGGAAAVRCGRSRVPNDRVGMAIIGAGNRGGRVFDSFCRQKDCQFLAAAEVNKASLDSWMTPARQTFKLVLLIRPSHNET